MHQFIWILKANLDGLDMSRDDYGCYDDDCLESTFWIDEMLDFIEEELDGQTKKKKLELTRYEILFSANANNVYDKFEEMTKFESGRFRTNAVKLKIGNEWKTIQK